MISFLRLIPELGKYRIALPVSLSAFTGFVAGARGWETTAWWVLAGVFVLAMGASALNQVQEVRFDRQMDRTRSRPIPSGRMRPGTALLIALILILLGSLILLWGCGWLSMVLGLLTILWYNVIYTYLKRITAFAVVPGSVVGALPPLIGWAASGVSLAEPAAHSLAVFFFIGQIPHFWLIILSIGKQYEEAGYPSLSAVLSRRQIGRLTLVWVITAGISALFLPVYGSIHTAWMSWALVAAVSWLIIGFLRMARPGLEHLSPRKGFIRLNLFVLGVMMMIWMDALLW